METIKFDLTANMAIIRKPDSNETYYTYNLSNKKKECEQKWQNIQ